MRQKWEEKSYIYIYICVCMCVCMYVYRRGKGQKQRYSNATWHANMQFSSDARGKPMKDVHMHKHEGVSGLIRISQCLRTEERSSGKKVK